MRRIQNVDPKLFKKSSKIHEKAQEPVVIVGNRDKTDYGFIVRNSVTKSFETLYLVVVSGGVTPLWHHAKKTRVVRVFSGIGTIQSGEEVKSVSAGDEIVFVPGVSYQISANRNVNLELSVTQDPKYESSLIEESPSKVVDVSSDLLLPVSKRVERDRRNSKAVEQLMTTRGQRESIKDTKTSADSFFRSANGGLNAKPIDPAVLEASE